MADNKHRKYGRNAKSAQNTAYRARNIRLRNKLVRALRTLRRQPENKQLMQAVKALRYTSEASFQDAVRRYRGIVLTHNSDDFAHMRKVADFIDTVNDRTK